MCHLYTLFFFLHPLFFLVELILLRLKRMFLQLGILGTSGTVRTSLPLGKKKKKKKKPNQNDTRDTKIRGGIFFFFLGWAPSARARRAEEAPCWGIFLNKYTSCGQGRQVCAMEWAWSASCFWVERMVALWMQEKTGEGRSCHCWQTLLRGRERIRYLGSRLIHQTQRGNAGKQRKWHRA